MSFLQPGVLYAKVFAICMFVCGMLHHVG